MIPFVPDPSSSLSTHYHTQHPSSCMPPGYSPSMQSHRPSLSPPILPINPMSTSAYSPQRRRRQVEEQGAPQKHPRQPLQDASHLQNSVQRHSRPLPQSQFAHSSSSFSPPCPTSNGSTMSTRALGRSTAESSRGIGVAARQRSGGQHARKASGSNVTSSDSTAWTRRRRQQTEHSSADEAEGAPPLESPTSENGGEAAQHPLDTSVEPLSPRQQRLAEQPISSVPQKRLSLAASAGAPSLPAQSSTRPKMPSHAGAQGSKIRSNTAHDDLEGHFAQVSMTPPASTAKSASVDAHSRASEHPVAFQPGKMTRTSAFGPFSPLQHGDGDGHELTDEAEGGLHNGLKRVYRLYGGLAPPSRETRKFGLISEGDSENSETSADERGNRNFSNQSPSVHAAKQRQGQRHVRSKTVESSFEGSSVAQRRGRTPAFLMTRRNGDAEPATKSLDSAMDLDSDSELAAPPSPSPMGSSDGNLASALTAEISAPVITSNGFLQPGPLSWTAALQRRGSAGSTGRAHRDSNMSPPSGLSTSSSAGQNPLRQAASPPIESNRVSRHRGSLSTSSTSSSSAYSANVPPVKLVKSALSVSSSPHKAKRRLNTTDKGMRVRASVSQEEQLVSGTQVVNQSFRFPNQSSSPSGLSREMPSSGRRSSTSNRSSTMGKIIAAKVLTSSDSPGTPSKTSPALHDDSGLGLSFTSVEDSSETPFRMGDRFLAGGFDDTPEKGLLGGSTGGTGSLVFDKTAPRTRKSTSCDSLASTPARPTPANINHRGPFNPFGPIQRSALANQATFTPGGTDSGPSSPDGAASQRTISVPEGLSAAMDSSVPYLTPQSFKNIKPLQTAFMSTGLVSKRTRGVAPVDCEIPPLPPRPNFEGNTAMPAASAGSAIVLPIGMAAAKGLKEVVAAAVRRASLGGVIVGPGGQQGPSVMPDTPMKKVPSGLAQHLITGMANGALAQPISRQPPPSVLRPTASSRPFFGNFSMVCTSALSASSNLTVPPLSPGQDSVSSGGESPVLVGNCDSPTMNLVSVSGSGSDLKNTQDWPRFSALPKSDNCLSPEMVPTPGLSVSSSTNDLTALAQIEPTAADTYSPVNRSSAQSLAPVSSRHPMRRTRTNAGVLPTAASSALMPKRADGDDSTNHKLGSRPISARSFSEQVGGPRSRSRLGVPQGGEVSESETGTNGLLSARPSFLRQRSRPGFGLQRKASFGVGGDGTLPVNSPTMGFFPIPSTPTRSGGPIKWFEAARLGTTPSPPSRRQGRESARIAAGEKKNNGKGSTSMLSRTSVIPATPIASSQHGNVGRFQRQFTQLVVLGTGEFSEAVKVEDKVSGDVSAVKRMKRRFAGPRDRLRHLEEVDILRHLGYHPNVISLVDAWEEDNHLFIQTELCPLGTLSFFLEGYGFLVGTLDEPRLWKVLAELSSGLQHIHSLGVLHLDLKPANIFVTEIGTLKIGDFGLASRWPTVEPAAILFGAQVGSTDPVAAGLPPPASLANSLDPHASRKQRRGSKLCNLEREGDREYLAPEIILEGRYSKAADVFSLGLIMVEAVGNVVMPDNGEPWQKLRNDDLSDVDFSMISVSLFRLIRSMLSSSPQKRPSVDEMLAHPVVVEVHERMKQGLRASELDQLPDFDLPRTRSGLSTIHSSSSIGSAVDSASGEHKGSGEGTDEGVLDSIADRSSSSIAAQVDPNTPALSIRGALIQEDESFLTAVLAKDPDPEARELAVMEWSGDASGEMLDRWTEDALGGRSGFVDGSAVLERHFADEPLYEENENEQPTRSTVDEEAFSMDVDDKDEDADAFS